LQWYAVTLAVENSALRHYRSEKVPESILAGVPLVLTAGDPAIDDWLVPFRPGDSLPEVLVVDMPRLPISPGLQPQEVLWGSAGVGAMSSIPVAHVETIARAALGAVSGGRRAVVAAALAAASAIPGAGAALFRGEIARDGQTARRCNHLATHVWPPAVQAAHGRAHTLEEWLERAATRLRLTSNQDDLLCSVCAAVGDSARDALREQFPW
jgi:hypothetical protein